MKRRLLTLDANVFVAALKSDEKYSDHCAEILRNFPKSFVLTEPSVIYQEVCGTLARRVGLDIAKKAERFLDLVLSPELIFDCDRTFCKSAYLLCNKYNLYSVDALYLKVALSTGAVLVSLDYEDFVERIRRRKPPIEVYHVSEFPY